MPPTIIAADTVLDSFLPNTTVRSRALFSVFTPEHKEVDFISFSFQERKTNVQRFFLTKYFHFAAFIAFNQSLKAICSIQIFCCCCLKV